MSGKNMSENGYYLIRNVVNGLVYIGSTKYPIEKRWKTHLRNLRRNEHSNSHLQEDYNKHGEFSFTIEVLKNGFTGTAEETKFILSYLPNCYNDCLPDSMEHMENKPVFKFRKPTGRIFPWSVLE